MKRLITFLFTALVLAALCAAQTDPGYGGRDFREEEGIASWYGAAFAGSPTASGEAFNPMDLTAAHPRLAFGTMLKVTNRQNNRQVIVRVNDRGPFVPNRIIDLSQAAAEQLDMIATGTAPVLVELADQVGNALQPLPPPQQTQPPVRTGTVNPNYYTQPDSASLAQGPVYQALPPPVSQQTGPVIYDTLPPSTGQQPSPETRPPHPDLFWSIPEAESPAPAAAPPPATPAPAASVPAPAPARRSAAPATIKPNIPPVGQNRRYRLQIGAYKVPRNATEVFDRLKRAGLNPAYERSGEYYRVVLADIRAEDVPAIAEKLGAAGFAEAFIREER